MLRHSVLGSAVILLSLMIASSSAGFNLLIPALEWPHQIGDYDADGIPDLMVKFPRQDLERILVPGMVTLNLTGELDGIPISGQDTIRVISPPIRHGEHHPWKAIMQGKWIPLAKQGIPFGHQEARGHISPDQSKK